MPGEALQYVKYGGKMDIGEFPSLNSFESRRPYLQYMKRTIDSYSSRESQRCNRTAQTKTEDKTLLDDMRNTHVDSKKGLTCNEDVAVTTVEFCKEPFKANVANPFEDQTPNRILTRQYKIAEITISPTWIGTTLQFPQVLLSVPAISDALNTFYYFHSDVEISIKLNSTPYHQGMMMASFKHDCTASTFGNLNTTQLSCYSPVLLNYSTSDTVDLCFSWMSPLQWININPYTSTKDVIGALRLQPLLPVANTMSTSETIELTVYARFVQPKAAGFLPSATMKAQAQSAEGTSRISPIGKEQEEKSVDSTPISDAPSLSIAPLFRSLPIIGTAYDDFARIVKTMSGFLDKPRDIKTQQRMIVDISQDMAHGTGLDVSSRVSLYPGSKLATKGIFSKTPNTHMLMSELAGTPVLHHIATLSSSMTAFDIGVTPEFCGSANLYSTDLVPDYLLWVQQAHKYWRGSIKYLVYFVTNSFTTARIRVSYLISPVGGDFALGGDFPSRIIEIKGTTKTTIQVPYLFDTVYRQTGVPGTSGTTIVPRLNFGLLTMPVAATGTDPFISVVIFRAGGEDMQFSQLQSSIITAPEPPLRIEAQSSVQSEFKRKFDPIACDCTMTAESGYVSSENSSRVQDAMRRYVMMRQPITIDSVIQLTWPVDNGVDAWRWPYFYFASVFRYFRGSVRIRGMTADTSTSTLVLQSGLIDPAGTIDQGGGFVFNYPSQNPTCALEVPWYSKYPYMALDQDSTAAATGSDPTQPYMPGGLSTRYVSAGDDFIMGYLTHLKTIEVPSKGKIKSPQVDSTSNSSRLSLAKTQEKRKEDATPRTNTRRG